MTPGITNPVPLPSPRINLDVKNSSFQGKDFSKQPKKLYIDSTKRILI